MTNPNHETTSSAESPVRRVGCVTLGISLIATGIFFLLYYFYPNFDWVLTLKIAPAVGLCLLGSEVLFFAAKPQRGKYDFLSVFICLILMGCCFVLSFLPVFMQQFSPAISERADLLAREYQSKLAAAFQVNEPDIRIRDIQCQLTLFSDDVLLEELDDVRHTLIVAVELYGSYDSTDAFAVDCRSLTDSVQRSDVLPDSLIFTFNAVNDPESTLTSGTLEQTESYTLFLSSPVQMNWTAEEMAQETQIESLLDEENPVFEVTEPSSSSPTE